MALRRYRNSKVWHYQTKVNGRSWTRSTGETDKRRARAKTPELEGLAELHRKRRGKLLRFSQAMVAEIARAEQDVGIRAAERASDSLRIFLKWLKRDIELEKITTELLGDFQRFRLRERATSTVNKDLGSIFCLLRHNGFHVAKPESRQGRKTRQRHFAGPELRRFFSAVQDETHEALFMLLLVTGARPAEVIPSTRSNHVALLKREVDVEHGTVTIRTAKMKPGQEDKQRVIRIPVEVMDRLVRQMERVKGIHVFPSNSSLAHLFDRILERAGVPKYNELGHKLTAHSFRHTFATIQAEAVNANPFQLKAILGHCQTSTTDRYCHARSNAQIIGIEDILRGVSSGCESGEIEQSEESQVQ